MRPSLRNLGQGLLRSKARVAVVAAVIMAIPVMAFAVPGTASAQTQIGETTIVLARETSVGMYAANGVTTNSPIETTTIPVGTWEMNYYGDETVDNISGPAIEFEAVATNSGTNADLCLTSTDEGNLAVLGLCGAGGTVFIMQSSSVGYILYSRYFLNLNKQVALATYGDSPGAGVFALFSSELTTGVYYRWAVPGY